MAPKAMALQSHMPGRPSEFMVDQACFSYDIQSKLLEHVVDILLKHYVKWVVEWVTILVAPST